VIEPPTDVCGEHRIAHCLRPIEEEVIVVEDILGLLGLDIASEQLAQLGLPTRAPRIDPSQHFTERQLGIHGTRIDRKAGSLRRKPAFRL
jgi:hypothetical protein